MAARRSVDSEKLTDENLLFVKGKLNPQDGTKPWTKKACCDFLGMAYNTTRLEALINAYSERVEYELQQRAAKRGTEVTKEEIRYIIESYLAGDSYETIAKSIFRNSVLVKNVLVANSVPVRPTSHDYFHPELIPHEAMRERFNIGEVVYSAKYNVNAEIKGELLDKIHGYVYRVWLLGDWQQFAYTHVSELASYQSLREIGIKI